MGVTCSKCRGLEPADPATARSTRLDSPDPAIYDLMRKSVAYTSASSSAQQQQQLAPPTSHQHPEQNPGQFHLLFKHQRKDKATTTSPTSSNSATTSHQQSTATTSNAASSSPSQPRSQHHSGGSSSSSPSGKHHQSLSSLERTLLPPTRLVVRRHSLRHYEEGLSGTHIYAIRYPNDPPLDGGHSNSKEWGGLSAPQEQAQRQQHSSRQQQQQQHQNSQKKRWIKENYSIPTVKDGENVDLLFRPSAMAVKPKQQVIDWVTVSEEHNIYIADSGLTPAQCDKMVEVTEQVCRGQYAAYTYAKQTLGCREFPNLATVCQPAIHTVTHAILEFSSKMNNNKSTSSSSSSLHSSRLALDDREPHMVKYDVTKKERQKLDMHTDKSEWTFLIALSNGCGMDYEGGGTYFECLDATVHVQRGHALIFPGKLRHCGQRITSGLRFLLVAFLVDKTTSSSSASTAASPRPAASLNDAPAKQDEDGENMVVGYTLNVP